MIRLNRWTWLPFCAALATGSCAMPGSSQQNIEGNGEGIGPDGGADRGGNGGQHAPGEDCEKIEGGDIGVEGVTLQAGDRTVTLSDWVAKEDSPGDFVGFTLDADDGEIEYRVKASTEVFTDDTATWLHPAGTSGPEAHGISYVITCPGDGDGGDGGDDGDGGDGGDDGDGGDGGDDGDDGDGGDDDPAPDAGSGDGGDGGDGGDDPAPDAGIIIE